MEINIGWLVVEEPDERTVQAMLTVAPETERWFMPMDGGLTESRIQWTEGWN